MLTSKGTGLDKGFWVVSASPVVWVGHHCCGVCGGGGHFGALTEQQLGITAFVKSSRVSYTSIQGEDLDGGVGAVPCLLRSEGTGLDN